MKTTNYLVSFETTHLAYSDNHKKASKWAIEMFTSVDIEESTIKISFKIIPELFSSDVLFETTSLVELKTWIKEHEQELKSQVQ